MKRLSRSLAAALVLALLAGCGQAQPGTDVNGSSSSVGQPNPSVSESSDGSTGGQTVPVLMGGALPFTGMESVTAENYPDGTYFYQDVTQDGQTDVFNVCQPNRITDGVDEDDYLCAAARALDPEASTAYQLGDVVQDPDDSQALSYPVYRITFTTGANEDQRDWTVFALNTDSHTYFYAFRATPQAAEDLSDLYADIFSQLTLADPAQSGNNAIRRNQT